MPDLPFAQQLYLGGVLAAFAVFVVGLAWGHLQANRPARQLAPVRADRREMNQASR